ncbi:MAG TPA: 30S ribosomal protein S6 [Ktedonobacteraceae bacterium]|nr:30S ribosomal protein S6 [Ktedonobacteraceae bacterium]
MRRDYELGFILNPEVNEEQSSAILERIQQIVNTHDGQVVRINQWGRRRLAYPIQHQRDGFYVFFDMILTPETVSELDRNLKVTEEVLRHMIVRRDPKIVQQEREEREEREARAAAQAAAQAQNAASEAEAPVAVETEEVPAASEDEAPIALSPEEMENVPSAIEDETETNEA